MLAFAKVVDIIVGLVVLLVVINVAVTPIANEHFDNFFNMGQDVVDYLNNSDSDFVPYDIEESFDVAGVSIMGLINAVKTLVATPFSVFPDDMDVAGFVGPLIDNYNSANRYSQGQANRNSILIQPIMDEYGINNDDFRDNFPYDKDDAIVYTQIHLLNKDMVGQDLFGKQIDSKEELNEYLNEYVNYRNVQPMDSFVYFSQNINNLNDLEQTSGNFKLKFKPRPSFSFEYRYNFETDNWEYKRSRRYRSEPFGSDEQKEVMEYLDDKNCEDGIDYLKNLESMTSDVIYGRFNILADEDNFCNPSTFNLPSNVEAGKSYYISYGMDQNGLRNVFQNEEITVPSCVMDIHSDPLGNYNINCQNRWALIKMPFNVYETDNEYKVGCSQYFNDSRRYCFTTNFELPEHIPSIQEQSGVLNLFSRIGDFFTGSNSVTNMLRARATAYQSPSYVFYYQTMPSGEEDAWGYTLERNVFRNIVFAGLTNAAIDTFKLVTHPVKAMSGVKQFVAVRKTSNALAGEIGQEVSTRLSRESIQRASREVFVESISGGQNSIRRAAQSVYFSDLVAKNNQLKNFVGSDEILSRAFRENDPMSYINNLGVGDLSGILHRSSSTSGLTQATNNQLQSFLGEIKKLANNVPSDITTLNRLMSANNFIDDFMIRVLREGGSVAVNEFNEQLTTKLVNQLDVIQKLSPDAISKIQQRISGEFDVVFDHIQSIGVDNFLEEFSDDAINSLANSISSELSRKGQNEIFSNLVKGRNLLRKPLILGSLILFDSIQNVGIEKYDPPKNTNQFVLYDASQNVKGNRVKEFTFEDSFSTYINIDKVNNNRFYVASPCKSDMLVRRDICTCEVPTGSTLLKQGDVLRMVENQPAGEYDKFYLYDRLSDSSKEDIRNQFERDFLTRDIAEKLYYQDLFSSVPELRQFLYSYFEQINEEMKSFLSENDYPFSNLELLPETTFCFSKEGKFLVHKHTNMVDVFTRINCDDSINLCELKDNNYQLGDLGLYYTGVSFVDVRVANPNFNEDNVELLFCNNYDEDYSSFEEFNDTLNFFLANLQESENQFSRLLNAIANPIQLEVNQILTQKHLDCIETLEKVCTQDQNYLQCKMQDENYETSCSQYDSERFRFSEGDILDRVIRELYVNFYYAEYDSVDTSDIVSTCYPSVGENIIFNWNRDVSDIQSLPLGNFLQTVNSNNMGYKKNNNYYFKINIPCVDVKTNNLNYVDYNEGYNFCHLSVSAENQQAVTAVWAGAMAVADVGISIAAATLTGGASLAVAPVINFATGVIQASVLDRLNKQYLWPNYQPNSWSD